MTQRSVNWSPTTADLGPIGLLLEQAVGLLSGIVLMGLMVLTCMDVIGRYVFLAPVPGTAEVTALGMGVLVFLALPLVTARGEHVSITFIDHWVSSRLAWPHFMFVQAFSAAALAFLAWKILENAAYLGAVNETTTFLAVEVAPFAYALGVLAGVSSVLNLLILGRAMRRRPSN